MKFKNFIGLLLAAAVSFSNPTAAFAGAAGNYYYTDIKTFLYHAPITSYNIKGKTVIDAEALNWHYGFDVYWRPETRRLELTDKGGMFNSMEALNGAKAGGAAGGAAGAIAGKYYKTDIITTLNGREIESYNIGGRTCIGAEAMEDFGYDVIWDGENRVLTITKPMDFYTIETDYGAIRTRNNYEYQDASLFKRGYGITGMDSALSGYAAPDGIGYIKLSDVESALGAECVLGEIPAIAHSEWIGGISYDDPYYQYRFDFAYDEGQSLELVQLDGGKEKSAGKCYLISDAGIRINGREEIFTAAMGGKEYAHGVLIADNIVYIPEYTAGKILAASFAE